MLPTVCRQSADKRPTVSRLLAEDFRKRRPTNGQQSADCWQKIFVKGGKRQSADSWPTVGQLSADCWSTVGRLSANCQLTVGQLSADCWPTVGGQSADCWPTVGRQFFRGAVLHFFQNLPMSDKILTTNMVGHDVQSRIIPKATNL